MVVFTVVLVTYHRNELRVDCSLCVRLFGIGRRHGIRDPSVNVNLANLEVVDYEQRSYWVLS